MKHIFLINKNAGNGKKINLIYKKIQNAALKCGINHEIFICNTIKDAEKAINVHKNSTDLIRYYACGGDGTLSVTANLLKYTNNAEIAVIPIGSGNDFTKSFTCSEYFNDIERQINGTSINADAVSCNSRYCVNLLNIGFDSQVVYETEKIRSHGFFTGSFAYIIGILKCLFYMPCVSLSLKTADEQISGDFLLAAIANASYYGGGFMAAPRAVINDGFADVLLVRKVSRLKFLSLVAMYKKGKIFEIRDFEKIAKFIRTDSLNISSDKDFLVSSDGELCSMSSADIKIINSAIRFVLPVGCEPINVCDIAEFSNINK